MKYELICFAPESRWKIETSFKWLSPTNLHLSYSLLGDLEALKGLGAKDRLRERKDELWKSTCFEFFLRETPGPAYVEGNFNCQGDWNLYDFSAYRKGLCRNTTIQILGFRSVQTSTAQNLELELLLKKPAANAKLNMCVVLENKEGKKFYWALKHGEKQPDFHAANGFCLDLATGALE